MDTLTILKIMEFVLISNLNSYLVLHFKCRTFDGIVPNGNKVAKIQPITFYKLINPKQK